MKKRWRSALWGAVLGVLLGTACSSALAPVVRNEILRGLLVEGFEFGIPDFNSSLGFFKLSFGFSFRFTLVSGLFMVGLVLFMLFYHFHED